MSVHSLPNQRPSADDIGAESPAAAPRSRARGQRRWVLIRHSWARAIEQSSTSDRPLDALDEPSVRRAA
jgi:hypothetical protein